MSGLRMRLSPSRLGRAARFAAGVCLALASPALGADAPAAARPAATAVEAVPVPLDAVDWQLRRAVTHRLTGDRDAVVRDLESLDLTREPASPEADRAAFLLACAYLERGDEARLTALVGAVARWRRSSDYTRWVARLGMMREAGPGRAVPLVDVIAGRGAPDRSPADASALLERAAADTTSALGRDLAGAAALVRATRLLERGEDARPVLAGVPVGSRYAPRARHLLGVIALERGDREVGEGVLGSLLDDHPGYPERREVWRALAGSAIDTGRWDVAYTHYARLDRDWVAARDTLDGMRTGVAPEGLWRAWNAADAGDILGFDAAPVWGAAMADASAATDLRTRPESGGVENVVPPSDAFPWVVSPPTSEEWDTLRGAERALAAAADAAARTRDAAGLERDRLARLQRYVAVGALRARADEGALVAHTAALDALRGTLDAVDARLRAVRDSASSRLRIRALTLASRAQDHGLWNAALRLYHLDGPCRGPLAGPGQVSADTVLGGEAALTDALGRLASALASGAPELVARSYEQAWRPGLVARAARLGDESARSLAHARRLATSLDSTYDAAVSSEALRVLAHRLAEDERDHAARRADHARVRTEVARAAVTRAITVLADEREGIDYGLASAAYGLSVGLGRGDSTAAGREARADALPTDAADPVLDSPEAVAWRAEAIARMRGFLERHPRSAARGETRFRLADLLLIDARQRYREAMAAYVRRSAEPGAPHVALPLLERGPALELYRTILREDPDFAHLDAVRFDAGMLLADDGDPAAERFFTDLVRLHPTSPYTQEAWLRMGDLRFAERRFREGIEHYTQASTGRDPSLRAIAFYKMGWAHFNDERFTDAADAFRAVLDLYGSDERSRILVDVEREAENDLILALARTGGADGPAAWFARIGGRPYELRVMRALGQHYRRYSLYADAAAVEVSILDRHPLHAEALASAERLLDTHRRAGRADSLRAARLRLAPRFAPGSAWAEAQTTDSLRASGDAFARGAWTAVALGHHERARAKGGADDWREARRLYETVLERWPRDPLAPVYRLGAGEADARLGAYPQALEHYAAAARAGGDSVAAEALWQRVAVTDAWYETTRAPGRRGPEGLGRDSLALAVRAAGEALLERFPRDAHAADVTWRQAHLALAHGWLPRAADDFGRLAHLHPDDPRAARAAVLRADALFRDGRYGPAGEAYEEAVAVAQRAGEDSLVRRATAALPVAAYRHAESAVAEDSTAFRRHADRFEVVADRWPSFPHADLARYRAGLAHLRGGEREPGVRSMERLIVDFPRSEYVRDAHLQIARALEAGGQGERAARAYAGFALRFPADASAGAASLRAADLFAGAGRTARADTLRLDYIRRHPEDHESAMEILEALARRELAAVDERHPVSALLGPARPARGRAAPRSHLADYLGRAAARPALAAKGLLAQVRFLEGEEARSAYAATRLTQPLERSIPVKQKRLDALIARYRACIELGVAEWADASAFRIGEALVGFGTALESSERPADLAAADLAGYDEVLREQAQVFYDRGEDVWAELARAPARGEGADDWAARARTTLWGRLGGRFVFRPEVDFPLVDANGPERGHRGLGPEPGSTSRPGAEPRSDLHAQREERPR